MDYFWGVGHFLGEQRDYDHDLVGLNGRAYKALAKKSYAYSFSR